MKNNIKTLFSSLILAFTFLLCSCSKNDKNGVDRPLVPKPDTLTTGWKKIVFDTENGYSDIFFNSNTNGYLAGKKLYRSMDGGLTWKVATDRFASNLSVTNDGKVFLASLFIDTIFRSTDGGSTLTGFNAPGATGFDVFFIDNSNGYYITFSGLYVTVDGGISWKKLDTPDINFIGQYSSLFFINTNTGWVKTYDNIYKTNGSNISWEKASFPVNSPAFHFQSIFVTPNNTVYVTTRDGELFKSTNGGLSFIGLKKFPASLESFCDVHFVDNNTGYLCSDNKIYKTTDAGSTWSTVVALGEAKLAEIHFTDANHGWACGSKGTVLVFNL